MGKTRDLFKKIRDTKETFHAKMGTIKDRKIPDEIKPIVLRVIHTSADFDYYDNLCFLNVRRQGSRPSPWKRNTKKQNGCLGRP